MELNIEKIKKEVNELDDSISDRFDSDEFIKILNSEIELSKLFVSCYDVIIFGNSEDFKIWLNDYLNIYNEIRDELLDYENGIGFGDWAIEDRIKNIVCIHRYSLVKFFDVFKSVFIE